MPAPEETLPKRAADLAAALLKTGSLAAAARQAKVPERTARRIAALPAFLALVANARRQALGAAVGQLRGLANKAVRTLRKKMDAPKDGDAIRAATAVLDRLFEAAKLADHAERLDRVEAELARRKPR